MVEKNKRFKLFVRPLARWAAHQTLVGRDRKRDDLIRGRFTAAEVDALLAETWHAFDHLDVEVSHEPTIGSRMKVRLAAVTLALFQSLLATGLSKE